MDLFAKMHLIPMTTAILTLLTMTILTMVHHPRVLRSQSRLFHGVQHPPLLSVISRQKDEIQSLQTNCTKLGVENIHLPDLSMLDSTLLGTESDQLMFFLETGDKPGLTIRQACAVESAEGRSGRSVILLMTSATVDVCSDKLLPVLHLPNLLVSHLNDSLLVTTTPLQPMFDDGRVNRSCCSMIHMSDIFRMAVLYR